MLHAGYRLYRCLSVKELCTVCGADGWILPFSISMSILFSNFAARIVALMHHYLVKIGRDVE